MAYKDKERKRANDKAYKAANKEATREKRRAQAKAWYEANREKIRAAENAYREANREKVRARNKAQYEARKGNRRISPYTRLNPEAVSQIKAHLKEGVVTRSQLARAFNVQPRVIRRIAAGTFWAYVKPAAVLMPLPNWRPPTDDVPVRLRPKSKLLTKKRAEWLGRTIKAAIDRDRKPPTVPG